MKSPKGLTIVIKLGTSSIVHEQTHEPRLSTISVIVETAVKLRRDGHRVVIVSSGAIGVALQMMDLEKRPKSLPQVQALAALGQCRLMSLWDRFFMHLKQPVAQILLTRNDIADRTQYLNAQNTMNELLNMGVIPIVNENDTLSVAEIKFGDNDTLSAITAAMLSADYLFLMTDVDCLYTGNPRLDPMAKPIQIVTDISSLEADVSSAGSALGTGGMGTKIVAAKLATAAGVATVITRSSKPGNVAEIVEHVEALKDRANIAPNGTQNGAEQDTSSAELSSADALGVPSAPLHTRFLPSLDPIRDRSFWLLHGLAPHGTIFIDEGAHRALRAKAGLLPVGIVGVEGNFSQQEAVRLVVVTRDPKNHHSNSSPSSNPSPPSSQQSSRPASQAMATTGLAVYENLGGDYDLDSPAPAPYDTTVANRPPSWSNGVPASATYPWEVGRALVNYAATEVARIKGLRSSEIERMLGYADSEYVALRENVSLFEGKMGEKEGQEERKREERDEKQRRKDMLTRVGDLGSFA